MSQHFSDAASIENAVLVGEFRTVNELSAAFVEQHRDDETPPAWGAHQTRLLDAATHAADAPDLDATLRAVAHFASACGACHRAQQAKVAMGRVHDIDPTADTMLQYRAAVESMWRGLIGPSDPHWQSGVEAYGAVVTCTDHADPSADPHAGEACNSILAAAASASAAKTDDARATAFADVIGSCARCHAEPSVEASNPAGTANRAFASVR